MDTLFVKNMVCDRCILVVRNELEKLGIHIHHIKLGEVTLQQQLTAQQKEAVNSAFVPLGFELLNDKKNRIAERIKNVIVEWVHHQDGDRRTNLSDLLSRTLQHDYNYLSNLFSEEEGVTIEKYFIAQKIEKVKELLVYGELSLSEIAYRLHYSSVAYLSNQFKKVTGMTTTEFKQLRENQRKPLDQV